MEFDFPEELKQLRDTARDFLTDRCPASVARRVIDEALTHDAGLWREMAGMGWLSATIPEQHGGLGLGPLAVCVLAEEIGRAIAPVPFASSVYLATEALLQFGSPQQQRDFLPQLADGSSIGTVAISERVGPLVPEQFDTVFADGYVDGEKVAVADGTIADFAIVAGRCASGGPALFLVDLSDAAIKRVPQDTIDPSRGHATFRFETCPAELLPGAIGGPAIRNMSDRAAVMMAFEQIGVASSALEMACTHGKERFAFGRPIGSFQAIKHKLADVYVALELARSNSFYGAWALESGGDELPLAAATSRVAACEAGWMATKENIQTYGGMGFTWELDCHLYYRRAELLRLALGSTREWKRRLMRAYRAQQNYDDAAAAGEAR